MQNRFKRVTLDKVVLVLERLEANQLEIKYPITVQKVNQGIGFKMYSSTEEITMFFYPGHASSEVSLVRKGMRYIYSKRDVRLRKTTLEELMNFLVNDQRLFGCTRLIECYLVTLLRADMPDIVESVYLS